LPEWSKSKLLGLPSFTTSSSGLKEPTVKSTAEIAKQTRDKDTGEHVKILDNLLR
jgi:hypothetical protein